MMILIHLLLLITSNVLAIDEEQKEIILGMIKELSRKAVQGEEIPADDPLSILPVKSMSTQRQTLCSIVQVIHYRWSYDVRAATNIKQEANI